MSLRFVPKALLCLSLGIGICGSVFAQGTYATNGGEYAIAGALPGDQVHPAVALTTNGGFLVWQDNITDPTGLGISALRLDSSFSGVLSPFRVNAGQVGDQERPQASLLSNGGAAFVWQGGNLGFQHIYARFLSTSNTWLSSSDILVNSITNKGQLNPALATLANGNVVVVYGSMNQQDTNSMQDVYGQVLSPTGQKIGGEFLVNLFTAFNQRTPSVATLSGGGFVVVWVSEQERSGPVDSPSSGADYSPTNLPSVDIYARIYSANGTPTTGEILVNTDSYVCANPRVAAGNDGGFMVTWGQKNTLIQAYSWDIFARPFSATGAGGLVTTVNTYLIGDQYIPQISALGSDYLIVWTSLGQDGSREGVFGQFLNNTSAKIGGEFQVNTTAIAQQMHPAVASDGNGRFLAVWTSYIGGVGSFDLYAQRYINNAEPLLPMNAPFVYAPFTFSNGVYQPQLQVSWPFEPGLPIDHYEVYVDGAVSPAVSVATNMWTLAGLGTSSTHKFQVAYVVADGRRSPLSPATSGSTWSGYSWGGIPFEWMSTYYGGSVNVFNWPSPSAALSPGGPTLVQVFLSGGNPTNPSTWLHVGLAPSPQGYFLTWNPQPGMIYQVQSSGDLLNWTNVSNPRFAAGAADSLFVGANNVAYYRILRLR